MADLSALSKKYSARANAFAEKIRKMDDDILFCAVMNKDGAVEGGAVRTGFEPPVRGKGLGLVAMRFNVMRGIDDTHDEYLGQTRSAVMFRDKITLMIVRGPEARLVFIGATTDFDVARHAEFEEVVARANL